uniref:NB-ARC domain-containing protein n=1 Tax=Leersia perrieri TaxID=77586 RepID=A0A0D9VVR5_9ORYZ
MDISSYLAVGGRFIQVIFDKYLSYQLRSWAADCGISHEMDRLRVALLRTQSVLHGAEVVPSLSCSSLPWMRELRGVIYDVEDLLDKLEYNRLHQQMQESNSTKSNSSPISAFMHSRFSNHGAQASGLEPNWDRSTKIKNQMVNLWERLEQVANGVSEAHSLPRKPRHSRYSIMTSSVTNGEIFGRELEIQKLASGGTAKKAALLLVLDDVWNNDKITLAIEYENWQKLLAPLKAAANGSKILLTTRSSMVAEMLQSIDTTHLEGLSEQDCWSLIKTTVFDDTNHTTNSQLENIGSEIAKTLSGLPLAAKSYENLPVHLQQCLAFCSIFPKDWEFEAEQLILMWMAQGYVYPDGCRRMEDIGKQYVDELFSRSFFAIQKKEFVSYYVIPPINHKLTKSVSAEECFEIGDIGSLRYLQRLPIFKVTSEETNSITQLGYLQELRGSLHIRNLENIDTPDEAKEALLSCGRAPARDEVNSNKEAEMLEYLQPHPNLKRLDITGWMGIKAPSWLESKWLINLELIFLSGCNAWEQLPPLAFENAEANRPRGIWQWQFTASTTRSASICQDNLVAAFENAEANRPRGIYGNGSSQVAFQSLEELVLDDMQELNEWSWTGQEMMNLRNSVIKDCRKLKEMPPLPPSLTELTIAKKGFWVPYHHDVKMAQLTTASITVSSLCIYNCPKLLARFFSPMTNGVVASFQSLRSLIVDDTTILTCPLLRERLEHIGSLDIQDCSEITNFTADNKDVFQHLRSLQRLCISGCNSLRSLPSSLSTLESLDKLIFWNCPELESLPDEQLPLSITKLEVALCNPLLKERLGKECGVDWPKIAHIPRVDIDGEILQWLQGEN